MSADQCQAVYKSGIKKGDPCTNKARYGDYCGIHNPDKAPRASPSKQSSGGSLAQRVTTLEEEIAVLKKVIRELGGTIPDSTKTSVRNSKQAATKTSKQPATKTRRSPSGKSRVDSAISRRNRKVGGMKLITRRHKCKACDKNISGSPVKCSKCFIKLHPECSENVEEWLKDACFCNRMDPCEEDVCFYCHTYIGDLKAGDDKIFCRECLEKADQLEDPDDDERIYYFKAEEESLKVVDDSYDSDYDNETDVESDSYSSSDED